MTKADMPECRLDLVCLAVHMKSILASDVHLDAARHLRGQAAETFMYALQTVCCTVSVMFLGVSLNRKIVPRCKPHLS